MYAYCCLYIIVYLISSKTQAVPSATSGSVPVQTVKIPDRFSFSTMEAMKSGNITRAVRIEIVAAVAFQVYNSMSNNILFHMVTYIFMFCSFLPTLHFRPVRSTTLFAETWSPSFQS